MLQVAALAQLCAVLGQRGQADAKNILSYVDFCLLQRKKMTITQQHDTAMISIAHSFYQGFDLLYLLPQVQTT